MAKCCDRETCERALEDYLSERVLWNARKPSPGPQLVHYEEQAGKLPIKLSFAVKVF